MIHVLENKSADSIETIAVFGLWNWHIFNPQWVQKYLFPKEELEVEYPIGIDGCSWRISDGQVSVSIAKEKLLIRFLDKNDTNYQHIESILIRICDLLRHTPVKLLFINFQFIIDKSEFNPDIGLSLGDGLIPQEGGFTLQFFWGYTLQMDNRTVNVTVNRENDSNIIIINHKFEIESLLDVKEILSKKTIHEYHALSNSVIGNLCKL